MVKKKGDDRGGAGGKDKLKLIGKERGRTTWANQGKGGKEERRTGVPQRRKTITKKDKKIPKGTGWGSVSGEKKERMKKLEKN